MCEDDMRTVTELKKPFYRLMMCLALMLLGSYTHANYVNIVLFSAKGEGGNVKEAIINAQHKLAQVVYKKSTQPSFEAKNFHIESNYLSVQKLGRTKDGIKAQVVVRLMADDYFLMLSDLKNRIQNILLNTENFQVESLNDLNQYLQKFDVLIALDLGVSLKNLQQNYRYQYLDLTQKLQQLTTRASITFIGETQGANLRINGSHHSSVEKIDNLLPGWHLFEISKLGYLNLQGRLYLNPGEHRKYFISLIKSHTETIFIQVELEPSLEFYRDHIETNLTDLGFETITYDEKNEHAIRATFSLFVEERVLPNNRQNIHNRSYTLRMEAYRQNDLFFTENWHQVYNFVKQQNVLKQHSQQDRIKDILQKALYQFAYRIGE